MEQRMMPSLIDQIRGVSYKPTDLHDSLDVDSIMLLRANNIDDGKINFDDVVYVDRKCVSQSQLLRKGDILICASSGSRNLVGKAAQVDFEGEYTFGAFCKVVRPRLKSDAGYIGMFFQSPIYRRTIAEKAQGININNIRGEYIDSMAVCWPDQSDRQRAVETYQVIRDCIRLRKRQLNTLDTLIKARFVEMFGECDYPLTELIKLIVEGAGLSYGIVQPGDDGTGDMGVLRPVDLSDGRITTASIKYIDRSIGDGFKKTELTGEELLITVRGTTGITALTDARFAGMNVTRGIAVIRYDQDKINPVYLNAYLNTEESQRYIQEHTRGATLQQINLSDLRVQQILVPPRALQDEYSSFVQQVDKSKVVVKKALDNAQLLYDSLMQKYFG